jgi:hypothetical protein
MVMKRMQQITRMFREGVTVGPKAAWRLQGAVLVAGMGVLALGILVASRQPQPVTTAAAMTHDVEESSAAARKARARRAENAVNSAVAVNVEEEVKPASDTGVVSITGCLERDDDTFRLKDTEGASAPKKRSWKSGFLKKGAANVEVIDASNRLRLQNHVGKRVRVTGQLHEREMLASSVRRVSASCE